MIKRLILGDIHGHNTWKDIIDKENPQEIIILGDYFDSFGIKSEDQIKNFKNILEFRKVFNKDSKYESMKLIMGNHDFHYIHNINEHYSGWNQNTYNAICDIFIDCIDHEIFKMCIFDEINNTLYSHAGVSNAWIVKRCNNSSLYDINSLDYNYFKFTFAEGGDCYGSSPLNSPIWIRPESLLKNPIRYKGKILTQIVGHTHLREKPLIKEFNSSIIDEENEIGKLYVIDTLPKYYMIEELNENNIIMKRNIKSFNI